MTSPHRLWSRRVLTADRLGPATVVIDHGCIAAIEPTTEDAPPNSEDDLLDLGDSVLMAGLVDTHVHLNDPGRTDWEGFARGTSAAAAGGITTLVDMPLNSVPTTIDRAALAAKRHAASGNCRVDVAAWGGCVPENLEELEPLWRDGVLGFKAFLSPSGVPEFTACTRSDLERAAPVLARLGATLLVHAEDPHHLRSMDADEDPRSYWTYLATRPPRAEEEAVRFLLDLAQTHSLRVHIVHLATGSLLAPLAAARQRGIPVTVETCPHYLSFTAEGIPEGGTLFKCAPPIRRRSHREALWDGLRLGTIDLIASDHSPSPPAGKQLEQGDFRTAWGGIASLQLLLPAVWTEARQRGFSVQDVAVWLSRAPARLAGLSDRKGQLAVGHDADLVAWQPEESFTVDARTLYHRHAITPWHGRRLFGTVDRTFLRGEVVFDRRTGIGEAARGRWIQR